MDAGKKIKQYKIGDGEWKNITGEPITEDKPSDRCGDTIEMFPDNEKD